MATKGSGMLSIDREALAACVTFGNIAARDLEPAVSEAAIAAKELCSPEALSGKEAEKFQSGVDHIMQLMNIALRRVQNLSKALNKCADSYGIKVSVTNKKLDEAKNQFDAIKVKAQAMTSKSK